jgi:hypothetical protein
VSPPAQPKIRVNPRARRWHDRSFDRNGAYAVRQRCFFSSIERRTTGDWRKPAGKERAITGNRAASGGIRVVSVARVDFRTKLTTPGWQVPHFDRNRRCTGAGSTGAAGKTVVPLRLSPFHFGEGLFEPQRWMWTRIAPIVPRRGAPGEGRGPVPSPDPELDPAPPDRSSRNDGLSSPSCPLSGGRLGTRVTPHPPAGGRLRSRATTHPAQGGRLGTRVTTSPAAGRRLGTRVPTPPPAGVRLRTRATVRPPAGRGLRARLQRR